MGQPDTLELELTHLHPGVSLDAVLAATGWPLAVAPELGVSAPPTATELAVLQRLAGTKPAGD